MRLQFTPTLDDYVEAHKAVFKAYFALKRIWFVLAIFAVLVILRIVLTPRPIRANDFYIVVATVPGPLLARWVLRRTVKIRYKKLMACEPSLVEPRTVEVSEQGLTWESQTGRGEQSWGVVRSYLEAPTHFILFGASISAYLLPKRAIDAQELDALRALLAKHVTTIYPAKKPPTAKAC